MKFYKAIKETIKSDNHTQTEKISFIKFIKCLFISDEHLLVETNKRFCWVVITENTLEKED